MSSLRRHEGYLLIDSRNTPGLPDDILQKAVPGAPSYAGRTMFETPTYTCSHCCRVVVMNPLRTRERDYCPGCDHYVCDSCGTIRRQLGRCRTFKQIVEETQEQAVQQQSLIIP